MSVTLWSEKCSIKDCIITTQFVKLIILDNKVNSKMKRKRLTAWQKWKKKAPKVPDITCPDIDSIITKLEKHLETKRNYTQFRHKQIVKTLEKLRRANESLRDGGEYWYGIAKENLQDYKK